MRAKANYDSAGSSDTDVNEDLPPEKVRLLVPSAWGELDRGQRCLLALEICGGRGGGMFSHCKDNTFILLP